MSNRHASVALLMPAYTIGVLVLLVLALTVLHTNAFDTEQQPVIGEKQQAVLDTYAEADALRIYAEHAARAAAKEAADTATTDTLQETIEQTYTRLLAANPAHPLYASASAERTSNGYVLRLQEPVDVRVRYGDTSAQPTATGLFTQWPLDAAPVVTSLFGGREVTQGSTNHPGIDIRASVGDEIKSIAPGEVVSRSTYSIYVRMQNGYTCGYLHVTPLKQSGDSVAQGETIARVANQPGYAPHLDLRCYNHAAPLSPESAREAFTSAHVGGPYTPPSDTTYVATLQAQSYLDPYCLFTQDIKQSIKDRIQNDQALQDSLSGLQERDQELPLQERLEETCNAYAQRGLLAEQGTVDEQYLAAVVAQIIENEGAECTDNAADRGGRTKWGVTADTLAAYRGIPSSQARAQVCDLTRGQAEEIFLNEYLYRPGFDELPIELVPQVFDMSVNHGQGTASRLLQEVLVAQGSLGQVSETYTPIPSSAVSAAKQAVAAGKPVNEDLVDRRIEYYQAIVESDASQEQFLAGWLRRAEKYRSTTLQTRTNAQGAVTFDLSVHAPLSAQERERVRERTQLKEHLQDGCAYGDEECVSGFIGNSGYVACTDYAQQLQSAIAQCAQRIDSGCSCALPLPRGQTASLTPASVSVNGTRVHADWTGEGAESGLPVRLAVAREHATLFVDAINYTGEGEPHFFSSGSQGNFLLFEDRLYTTVQRGGAGAVVLVRAQNATPVCEHTLQARYCRGQERFSVEHPATLP